MNTDISFQGILCFMLLKVGVDEREMGYVRRYFKKPSWRMGADEKEEGIKSTLDRR